MVYFYDIDRPVPTFADARLCEDYAIDGILAAENVEVHHPIYTSPLETATGSRRGVGHLRLSAVSDVKRLVHIQPLCVQQECKKEQKNT